MAMYVWDRFTMSLVLMYSKPTCKQRDRSEGALLYSHKRGTLGANVSNPAAGT